MDSQRDPQQSRHAHGFPRTYQQPSISVSNQYHSFTNFSDDLLYLLKNWDQMKLKTGLKYKEQFVIVSQQVWSYLCSLFGGGPEIEFITEPFILSNISSAGAVTDENEKRISKNSCVNMDLKKLRYIKTGDKDPETTCYVSLTVNAKAFFETVCRKTFFPLFKCEVRLLASNSDYIVLKDYTTKTLADLGIQENSVLEFVSNSDSIVQSNPEPERRDNGAINTSKNDVIIEEENYYVSQVNHIAIPLPNSETVQISNNDCEITTEKKWDIDYDKVLLVNKQVDQVIQTKQKLSLDYKPLTSIKTNLKALKGDWHSKFKTSTAYKNFKKKKGP